MSATIRYFVVCDDLQRDSDSGKLTCMGFIDGVGAMVLPSLSEEVHVVLGFTAPMGAHAFKIELLAPSDVVLMTASGTVPSKDPFDTINVLLGPQHLPLASVGVHRFRVSLDDEVVGEYPLKVDYAVAEPPALSAEEIAQAISGKGIVSRIEAKIGCPACKKEQVFFASLDPEARVPDGAKPFPLDGIFRCECGREVDATAVFRQARAYLGRNAPSPETSEAAATTDSD